MTSCSLHTNKKIPIDHYLDNNIFNKKIMDFILN